MKLLTLVMNLHLLHLNLTQHPAIYNIHTHTRTKIHQPFVLLLICLAGSKKRIKNGRAY